jgi:riboflavin biosynthesis pyrimidine reductase
MRSLLPASPTAVDALDCYSRDVVVPPGRPFVRVNMISTLDGAVAFAGRSGPIGGAADRALFVALRSLADVVLVGAGTVRAENYGRARLPSALQALRAERGQAPLPAVAVVTRGGRLDWGGRLFTGAGEGPLPLVIMPSGALTAEDARLAQGRAEVVEAGGAGTVDIALALAALAQRGARHVLCEGGPGLNTSLMAAGAVDEICLTLSPTLAGCVGGDLVGGWLGSGTEWLSRTSPDRAGAPTDQEGVPPLTELGQFDLVHVLEEDGFIFLRHRARPGQAA